MSLGRERWRVIVALHQSSWARHFCRQLGIVLEQIWRTRRRYQAASSVPGASVARLGPHHLRSDLLQGHLLLLTLRHGRCGRILVPLSLLQALLLVHEVAVAEIELVLLDGILDVDGATITTLFAFLNVAELVLELVAVATRRLGRQGPLNVGMRVSVLSALNLALLALAVSSLAKGLLRHRYSLTMAKTLEVHDVHGLGVVAARRPGAAALPAYPVDDSFVAKIVPNRRLNGSLAALCGLHLH